MSNALLTTCPHGYAEPMLCRSCWPHEKVTAWYDQNREAIARAALPDVPTRSRVEPEGDASEVERLRTIIERERSASVVWIRRVRAEVGSRRGIAGSRGPYEWNDDAYFAEFGAALDAIDTALDAAERDTNCFSHTDCPATQAEVDAARSPRPDAGGTLPTDADDAQWHEDATKHYETKAAAFERENPYTAPELNPFANTARAHRRAAEAIRARSRQPDAGEALLAAHSPTCAYRRTALKSDCSCGVFAGDAAGLPTREQWARFREAVLTTDTLFQHVAEFLTEMGDPETAAVLRETALVMYTSVQEIDAK